MDKAQIIRGLSEVQQELTTTTAKLNNLINEPIWSTEVAPELDDSVGFLRALKDKINELIDIQRKVLSKENK